MHNKKYYTEWRNENLEKVRQQSRDWARREKEKDPIAWKKKQDERAKKYRAKYMERYRERSKLANRKKRLEDRDGMNRKQREYRKNNPEKFKRYHEQRKDKHKAWARKNWLIKKYGLTEEQYNHLLTVQEGKCAICKRDFNEETPKIDHCHERGDNRGLLCQRCNLILGYLEKQLHDNVEILNAFATYLKTHNCWEKHQEIELNRNV